MWSWAVTSVTAPLLPSGGGARHHQAQFLSTRAKGAISLSPSHPPACATARHAPPLPRPGCKGLKRKKFPLPKSAMQTPPNDGRDFAIKPS
ncbi:hypothetical protein BCV70DRAFT_25777 [Testicularia cyperi]|uniref:Uncharacterized protein n=1 Tax=Testicularia cyperi TaxID=1882483 RepID=A0A317XLF7_9BASI|nr:hypothetical protein BCV70DRAFT_25777 [Testicularia cyperi]